jgi:hypothetical protein
MTKAERITAILRTANQIPEMDPDKVLDIVAELGTASENDLAVGLIAHVRDLIAQGEHAKRLELAMVQRETAGPLN